MVTETKGPVKLDFTFLKRVCEKAKLNPSDVLRMTQLEFHTLLWKIQEFPVAVMDEQVRLIGDDSMRKLICIMMQQEECRRQQNYEVVSHALGAWVKVYCPVDRLTKIGAEIDTVRQFDCDHCSWVYAMDCRYGDKIRAENIWRQTYELFVELASAD